MNNYNATNIQPAHFTLNTLIEHHHRTTHTPPARARAVQMILRGIFEWITDEPTITALIIEDIARMIERCEDVEELRDLSVEISNLMMEFEPDASRVALTEDEARVLNNIGD